MPPPLNVSWPSSFQAVHIWTFLYVVISIAVDLIISCGSFIQLSYTCTSPLALLYKAKITRREGFILKSHCKRQKNNSIARVVRDFCVNCVPPPVRKSTPPIAIHSYDRIFDRPGDQHLGDDGPTN